MQARLHWSQCATPEGREIPLSIMSPACEHQRPHCAICMLQYVSHSAAVTLAAKVQILYACVAMVLIAKN